MKFLHFQPIKIVSFNSQVIKLIYPNKKYNSNTRKFQFKNKPSFTSLCCIILKIIFYFFKTLSAILEKNVVCCNSLKKTSENQKKSLKTEKVKRKANVSLRFYCKRVSKEN